MAHIEGRNLIVALGGVAIAGAKSCDIETNCDMLEVSSQSSGEYRTYRPGRKVWRVTVNRIIPTNSTAVLSVKNIGTSYTLKAYVSGNSSVDKIEGTAILMTAKTTATQGNLVQGSWVFQGSGDI